MLAALISGLLLSRQDQYPQGRASLTGHIEKALTLESKLLGNRREILVYLPPQYESEPRRRFPVLYMHDGQNVFDGATSFIANQEWKADESAEALIYAKLVEPLVIVAIPNAGAERANEYLPTAAKLGNDMAGGKADVYGRMILEELKPQIDARYRTKKDAANTALAGSSFGGIATLYLGLTRANSFGKLGVFSPSLFWDDQVMLLKVNALGHKLPLKIWLDMGTAETKDQKENWQIVQQAREMTGALERKGWTDGKDLAYYEDGYAPHNEVSWARRFPAMLMFLFPAKR